MPPTQLCADHAAAVAQLFVAAPFVDDLGIRFAGCGPGWCESTVTLAPRLLQQDGFAHAGLQGTMADHTCGAAALTMASAGDRVLGVEFKINLLRPAAGARLRCRAEVLRAGRQLTVVEAWIHCFAADEASAATAEPRLTSKATVTIAVVAATPPAPGASAKAEDDDELLEVLDADGRVAELRRRGEIHGDPRLAHRAVHVFVRNGRGELFLQQRSVHKRIQPGRWDTSVGGHVDPGESYEQAAVRELGEELGVAAPGPLRHLHDYVWRTDVETEHVRTFAIEHDGPFHLHPEEISQGRFWSEEELRRAVTSESHDLTPNLVDELRRLGIVAPG